METALSFKIPLVIHRTHGGFHFTDALVAELRSRDWAHLGKLCKVSNDRWYVERPDSLRRDPVLIECVKKFEAEVQQLVDSNASWKDVAATALVLLSGLQVVEVTVVIDVDDFDGLETVRVSGGLY